MGYLSRDVNLSSLAERYPDPEDPGSLVSSFILCTRGPKNKSKFEIVNRAMICFVHHHKMNKAAHGMTGTQAFAFEYQSTSWETMIKSLFSFFSEFGVLYKHPTDFQNGRGTYTAVLDRKFTKISREREDFGALPNRSAIDMASYPKIVSAIKAGELKPHTSYDDLIMLVNFLVGVSFMLRGRTEHALLNWSNFRFSKVVSGKYLGRTKLELVGLQDKSMHVSVKNPVRRDNTGCLDAVECIENKLSCVVYWVQYYRNLCPPEQVRFYCYKAHNRLKKVSIFLYLFILLLLLTLFFNLSHRNSKKITNPFCRIPRDPLATISWPPWRLCLRSVVVLTTLISTRPMASGLLG